MYGTYAALFAKNGFTTNTYLTDGCHIIHKDITPENSEARYTITISHPLENGEVLDITVTKTIHGNHTTVANRQALTGTTEADEAIAAAIWMTKKIAIKTLIGA